MVGTVSDPRVGSVRFDAQELHVNERVERPLTQRPLDAAEPLRLFKFQSQARHFQILGAETFEHFLIRRCAHGDLSETPESRDVKPHRISYFAFCLQPVIDIVSVLAASLAVQFKRSMGDVG